MARDEDEGENGRVSYRIQAGNSAGRFSLNPNTGKLIFRARHIILKKKVLKSCGEWWLSTNTQLTPHHDINRAKFTFFSCIYNPCFDCFNIVWLQTFFCRDVWLIHNQHPTHSSPMDEQKFPGDCDYPTEWVTTAKALITLITHFTSWAFSALGQYLTWIML